MMQYIRWFDTIGMQDIAQVGGKNSSLGQMIRGLKSQGILVPDGFAITADAYREVVRANNIIKPMQEHLAQLHANPQSLKQQAAGIRDLIQKARIPTDMQAEILDAYRQLSTRYNQQAVDVAVRSSATAEDLPEASFAGQQDSFLNIRGDQELLQACLACMASLFTERAIVYREQKGFDHFQIGLSVGIQKMVRSDLAVAGIAFSLEPESGFRDVVVINASYGLGESIVRGLVTPDEFTVFKPTLVQGFRAIIQKKLGDKLMRLQYGDKQNTTRTVQTTTREQQQFCLSDETIMQLARDVMTIENYYSTLHKQPCTMDVEWAIDGIDGTLYIVQARPETVHRAVRTHELTNFTILDTEETLHEKLITIGQSIGRGIVSGPARVIATINDIDHVREGEILVTPMTDPDWVPVMKKVNGIVTTLGGRTCHAAIVSRELNRLAIVGARDAMEKIKTGQLITLDASQGVAGFVYDGAIDYTTSQVNIDTMKNPPVPVMVNLANPAQAFEVSQLPVQGVGLARIEFIIAQDIQIHPLALLNPSQVTDIAVHNAIKQRCAAYPDEKTFFVQRLAEGIGTIAAAFFPRPVLVRFSDFKTNEYRNLIGGIYFEPEEANPMIGFRGASRYYHAQYKSAFELECQAISFVRTVMGLTNCMVMIPFVRTVGELKKVIAIMHEYDLISSVTFKIYMMCEIPSNVLLIEQFSPYVDGFSIGSNDLTQLTLGIDRDSALLAPLFHESDPAVKKAITMAITGAHRQGKTISVCGQGPSDDVQFAEFLIELGIDAVSLNSDAVLPFITNI